MIATSSSDEKLKIATKFGAKYAINYKTTPNWAAEVLKLTGGVGVDHVVEVQSIHSCFSFPSFELLKFLRLVEILLLRNRCRL